MPELVPVGFVKRVMRIVNSMIGLAFELQGQFFGVRSRTGRYVIVGLLEMSLQYCWLVRTASV